MRALRQFKPQKERKRLMPPQQQKSEAPQFGQFDNPVTLGILILIIALIVFGLYMCWLGNGLIGFSSVLIAATILSFGMVNHSPSKPREAGLITILDSPLLIGGNYILIAGRAWVIPWLMSTVKFTMDNVDETFKGKDFVFQTEDNIPMEIEVSFTGAPDENDLLDFIQAGADMRKICSQIREIIFRETQKIVRTMNATEIQTQGEKLSELLTTCVLEAHSFGIKILKLQVVPALPDEIRKKMIEVARETYDRQAEFKDYAAIRDAAQKMQDDAAKEHEPGFDTLTPAAKAVVISKLVKAGNILTLHQYEERVLQFKLVREGKTTGINTASGTKTIGVVPTQ